MEKIDKSFFTREREAELSVVGESVQRADARGHVTGRTQFYEDVSFPEHAAPEDGALDAPSRADQGARPGGGAEGAGRRAHPHPQGRSQQLVHHPQADRRRTRRRAGAAGGPRAVHGRADLRGSGRQPAGRARRRPPRRRGLRGPSRRLRRRGGDDGAQLQEARHQLLRLRRPQLPPHPFRRRRQGIRHGRPYHRAALRIPRRSSMRRPSRPAASPSPRATAASPSIPTRRRSISRSTTWR